MTPFPAGISAGSQWIQSANFRRAAIKPTEWSTFRILAKGPKIQIWVNGVLMVDVMNESSRGPNGTTLALQLHAGQPMMIQFKDLMLKDLK